MPEPGFNDPDSDRPATGRGRRRTGKPVKLPVEYTEFRLSDGRFLGEVLGEGFFDAENSQPIPESERLRIRGGNYALAGMFREDPQFRPRPEPAEGAFDGEGARGSAAPANRGPGTATARGASMANHASPTMELEAEDADGAVAGLAMSGRMAKGVGSGLAKPDVAALGVGPRAFARKKLPGVGAPVSLQEAYDRIDAEEKRLARMGRDIDAGGMMTVLGLEPVYRPDGDRPVDHFGAKVEEYIKGSRSERAGLRDQISFDDATSELAVTQDNFRNYLDGLDKRADIHDDSFDGDVRAGQAAVNARKRDARAALERERAATEARLNEFDRYADIEAKRLRAEADRLGQKLSSDYGHMQNIADLPDDQQKIMKLIGENRAKAAWLEQNLETWRRQAEEDLANKERRLRELTGDRVPVRRDAAMADDDNEAEFINLPSGMEEENAETANVDPRSIADMDDAGLSGLVDINKLAAVEPKTYDDYMRYGRAIGEVAGYSHIPIQRLATVLSGLRWIERNIAMAPEGPDGEPSQRQQRALAAARADAAGFYRAFVEKALARRDTPLDLPRTVNGAIDMSLVQPGFVYKAKDGVLFMVDPTREKFAEARKLLKPNAEGRLYEPIPAQSPVQLLDERGWPRPAGQILTETHGLITRADMGFAESRMMKEAALALSTASRDARKLYGDFKRLDFEAPDSPAADAAQDKYLEAWKTLREKEESFRKMLSPENVGAREMMFRVEGRGPYVTHKIPMTEDGQIDARYLEKGKIYEVEDGRYFQFDEDGEDFVEMRRLGKPDEHGRAFAPIPDQQSTSLTADLRASQGGYGPSIVPRPLKLTDKFGNILPPDEIEVAAKTLAEQAGRGGYQATVIGTRAREAAEVLRLLVTKKQDAERVGFPEEDYPAIATLENRYRDELSNLRGLRDDFLEEIKPEMVSIEAMPERADDPGRLGHAGNRSLRTIGEFGAIPGEAWASQRARNARTWKGYFDRIDAGEDPRSVWKRIVSPQIKSEIKKYYDYPEMREQLRETYVPYLDARMSRVYEWSQELRADIESITPLNKRFEGDFFTDVLPEALADAATKGSLSVMLSPLVPVPVSLAMMGMIDESATQFRAALERGVPLDEAYEIFGFGGIVGLSEGLPVATILEKLNVATGGMANGLLWAAFKGVTEGRAIEEVKAALIQNINKGLEEAQKLELASEAEIRAAAGSNGIAELVFTMLGKDG